MKQSVHSNRAKSQIPDGKRLKILTIHNFYQQSGGERTAVEAEVALLQARGNRVVLYARDNAEIERYGLWQKVAFIAQAISSHRTYQEIQSVVRDKRPDVAHIHNVFPLISPSVYRALADVGLPMVQTMHNFRFLCPNGLFYTRGQICERCKYGHTWHAVRLSCYRKSYVLSALYSLSIGIHRHLHTFERIDRFIALTEFSARKLVESGITTDDHVSILGHFRPAPMPTLDSPVDRAPYVIYMGRLSPEKGIKILLKAMSGVPNLQLKVLGDGPQAEALQETSRQQVQGQVTFLGYVAGERKRHLLQRALALVVPSICYETFGIAALESLAVGTPVIASNLGSLPYIVQDEKSGLLFRPGDAQDLQQKLAWLSTHPEAAVAMGQYGRQVVQTHYSAQKHYERLMDIYTEVRH